MYELILFLLFIAIFLAGMAVLRIGLFNMSGAALKTFLSKVTDRPWKGFFAGTIFTGILQSSSAVMVMTVGLVSAGSLTFPQTIGIILGTNIGSTFTAEFMTISLDRWIIPGVISGAILCLMPKVLLKSAGMSLIGISAIFAAMSGFKMLSKPIAVYPSVQTLISNIEDHMSIALLAGILLTAMIHSSSATIGIAMSFLMSGELSVASAIIMMLGSNIGTCITGYMASIGSGRQAAFTAYAHIWLNVIGVAAFLPLVDVLERTAAFFTDDKGTQLAHASVIFNIVTSLIVLPFARQFSNFILLIHRPHIKK
ncbi:Na/Pi symporter [Peribacillus butanolivorans]|uniref:Na/Pi cotransporter family protein n=1 Tax=Peribacillus butanolivorans TaxID=421767 RepID=A0ABM6XGX6_9BACI|nr:Na/Pi symporter [Peribacillus butanolivorans]AXN37571.1 Na/Pi cotransporter family protein [Peribacillus butanolivorans]KON70115.1 Na/Pi cotransporter [Peribacillus butanolivorans]MCO0599844.1 Na/Pi symporter [Peribacillus butanolivorans]